MNFREIQSFSWKVNVVIHMFEVLKQVQYRLIYSNLSIEYVLETKNQIEILPCNVNCNKRSRAFRRSKTDDTVLCAVSESSNVISSH